MNYKYKNYSLLFATCRPDNYELPYILSSCLVLTLLLKYIR